jgi:phosphomannomutase
MLYQEALQKNLIRRFDPVWPYYEHLADRLIDMDTIHEGELRVVADGMYGSGRRAFSEFLSRTRTRVFNIRAEMNPGFGGIHPEPIARYLEELAATVKHRHAHVGLATDGDADRIGFIDEHGKFVDQLRSYALLAYYMLEIRGDRGPIVKTISTTSMLNKLGEIYGVPVYETGVGFKYVAPKMVETDAMIGGEESGGYAFRGNVPERDGILAGLYMLDFMLSTGKTLSQLIEQLFELVGPHYYDRIDVRFPNEKRPEAKARMDAARPEKIAGLKVVGINTLDGYKFEMEDGGWLLVRFSGTEPIIRVYTETTREDLVRPILEEGLRIAGLKED